jgi:hypothetical protein
MREDSAHARNHDLSAAAEIFAKGTYFPNTLRETPALEQAMKVQTESRGMAPLFI